MCVSAEASKSSHPGLSPGHVPRAWYFQWLLSREELGTGMPRLPRTKTTWAGCGAAWEEGGNSAGPGLRAWALNCGPPWLLSMISRAQ